jgi:hypothetical protein
MTKARAKLFCKSLKRMSTCVLPGTFESFSILSFKAQYVSFGNKSHKISPALYYSTGRETSAKHPLLPSIATVMIIIFSCRKYRLLVVIMNHDKYNRNANRAFIGIQ